MKYRLQISESVNHDYIIEANSEEDAIKIYHNYTTEQLQELDLDGQSMWEPYPWDIELLTEGEAQ